MKNSDKYLVEFFKTEVSVYGHKPGTCLFIKKLVNPVGITICSFVFHQGSAEKSFTQPERLDSVSWNHMRSLSCVSESFYKGLANISSAVLLTKHIPENLRFNGPLNQRYESLPKMANHGFLTLAKKIKYQKTGTFNHEEESQANRPSKTPFKDSIQLSEVCTLKGSIIQSKHQPSSLRQAKRIEEKFFEMKSECLKILLNKRDETEVIEKKEQKYSSVNLAFNSIENFQRLAFSGKEASIQIQIYLKGLDEPNQRRMISSFRPICEQMISDRFANYVLQYLLEMDEEIARRVGLRILSDFFFFAQDEYGSRTMQKLASVSADYCCHLLSLYNMSFDLLISTITGSILLSKLVALAQKEEDLGFLISKIRDDREYLRSAGFNRALSVLVDRCSDQMLADLFDLLQAHIWTLVNDKFGNYVLQVIYERGRRPEAVTRLASDLILAECLKNIGGLVTRKYPKFLLIRIIELDADGSFSDQAVRLLCSADLSLARSLFERKESKMILMLLLTRVSIPIFTKHEQTLSHLLTTEETRKYPGKTGSYNYSEYLEDLKKIIGTNN